MFGRSLLTLAAKRPLVQSQASLASTSSFVVARKFHNQNKEVLGKKSPSTCSHGFPHSHSEFHTCSHSSFIGNDKNHAGIKHESILEVEERDYQKLLTRNRKWVEQMNNEDPEFFKRASAPQKPEYLFIGCSDSRVPAEILTGSQPGELFVHRNVANMVLNTDINCLSVLQFAVEALKVKHVVVCGHYGCGGIKAAVEKSDRGVIENWLRNVRDIYRLHEEELEAITDFDERLRKVVEYNVVEQCINLFKTSTIQNARLQTGFPRIHGFVYDMADGELKELPLNLSEYVERFKHIYKLYT